MPNLAARFRALLPDAEFASLRVMDERTETLTVRQDVLQPVRDVRDAGGMVTVHAGGGIGYAATADLSDDGLQQALARARAWAVATGSRFAFPTGSVAPASPAGTWRGGATRPWSTAPLKDRLDLLFDVCSRLRAENVVERTASLMQIETTSRYITATGEVEQSWVYLLPDASVVAAVGDRVQSRSLGGGRAAQGGMETLGDFADTPTELLADVQALLAADDCPSGAMDVVLAPDQMMLQIHESIGHPLELDRILGDERNYAGTSFVTQEMFGAFKYGSPLLNITFDPALAGEFASYGWDDAGTPAERVWIIRNGLLETPLGSALSQARAGISGTANARACSWNRPPIDRMANLNLEVGTTPFEAMIAGIERGVYLKTNRSWSIDDQRDKFQFGCEWGQLIEGGKLTKVVRNPNYRGRSKAFWQSLAHVGDAGTWGKFGTPYCGKGEPNQVVRVGHASPACHFTNVDVFGGE
ncbi:peptidase C69 [Deltaproteobacteria bacterium]|nr:peptidase C69 [Deltaproteobacteria bacterium]